MPEKNPRRLEEFKIGDILPILEHQCKKGSLGEEGKLIEIDSRGIPVVATCLKCNKPVSVDIKTIKLSY